MAYALGQGLSVIYCIGEKLEEREAGNTMAVNARQMKASNQGWGTCCLRSCGPALRGAGGAGGGATPWR